MGSSATGGKRDDPLDAAWRVVASALEALERDDSPYHRRTYVRTTFAAVEALAAFLRQEALESVKLGSLRLSNGEIAVLREERGTP